MKCQFCGHQLTGTQTKTCSKRACLLSAKRARSRARREADSENRPPRNRDDDGRTWDFPPELEYLNRDPGIPVELMLRVRHDATLRVMMLEKRAARNLKILQRLKVLATSG